MTPRPPARRCRRVPAPRAPRRAAGKSGFTLAESVVALAILVSGALVLVAATAAAVRAVAEGDAQAAAILVARNRVELLASTTCQVLRDGSASDSATGVHESWRIVDGRSPTRFAVDSVEYTDRRGQRRVVVIGRLILC